jgi:hypothetical protein
MSTNQEFLRIAILEIFYEIMDGDTVNPISLEDLNKFVYLHNEDAIIDRGIEWTWQHLIASTRKYLVDSSLLKRDKVDGITLYTLVG